MTDPFSVAAGVVGVASLSLQLLGGCIKGFVILSTARNLEKDAAVTVCMLNLQEIQLIDWARRAGLLAGAGALDRRINAIAVEETLATLQSLLLDTERLKKKYGLDIQSLPGDDAPSHQDTSSALHINTGISPRARDLILARSQVAESHSALKRFRWATIDKGKVEKLVADIHFLIRELWHLLDPWRQDDLMASTQSIAASMISLNDRFAQLASLNEVLTTLRHGAPNDLSPGDIDLLATSARIKAYRVGLEQTDDQTAAPREPDLPPRQRLLGGLEYLLMSRLGIINPMGRSKTMGTCTYDHQVVFVEEKPIPPFMQQKGLARAKALAALLNVPENQAFGSLQCRGIIEARETVKFVFHHPYPESLAPQPRSLLELFHHRDGIKPPSLTKRISLARHIARLVRNFHRAGWLHKSLRSENILFFSSETIAAFDGDSLTVPILAGFAFSRQDRPTEISEQPSADPQLDIYRHPSALGEPTTSFTAEMDVYSLGIILLEIAEWRALRHLVDSVVNVGAEIVPRSHIAKIRPFLIAGEGKGGTSKLRERMGDIYVSVCQMCFTGKVVDVDDDGSAVTDAGLSLLDTIIARLDQCRV